ncbi:MAG: phosphopantetheine-binding protein [Paludibacteraceae bacterium]|jgi:acyl carrier protein|nr:phosphopantetheine-binding protein [Paludibacteraceae bacterium]
MKEFINNFANQWDETELEVFTPECEFHELEEWSSLTGLAILNMIAKKYEVKVAPAELKACVTIQDVYDLIQSKK